MCEIFGVSSLNDFTANDYLHPHGWGLACVSRNGALVEKESIKASCSNYLRERLSQPINAKILLAHIRYATIGNVEYKNCHPFTGKDSTGRRWTLIHNGTIFDFAPLNPYVKKQKGDTDSERIFLYLLDKLNEAQTKAGKYLYAHTNCKGTLHYLQKNGVTLIATRPLSDANWQPLPFSQLLAFNKGRMIKAGTVHNHEYIESEEAMKLIYQIFANL